jgi:hypothetical protein
MTLRAVTMIAALIISSAECASAQCVCSTFVGAPVAAAIPPDHAELLIERLVGTWSLRPLE